MSTSSFTVLLVQGSWHADYHAQPLAKAFAALKVECENCWFPSTRVTSAPIPDPSTDAARWHTDFSTTRPDDDPWPDASVDTAFIEARLRQLIEKERKTVVIVAHSWGGMPASEAIKSDLTVASRTAVGEPGGVAGIMYLTAMPVPIGASTLEYFISYFGEGENASQQAFQVWPSGLLTCNGADKRLFSHAEQQAHSELVARMTAELRPQPFSCHTAKQQHAGYKLVPCGYLICEQDLLVPPGLQEELVNQLQKQGVDVQVWRRQCGHEPAITQPDDTAGVVLEFVRGILPSR